MPRELCTRLQFLSIRTSMNEGGEEEEVEVRTNGVKGEEDFRIEVEADIRIEEEVEDLTIEEEE